MLIIKNAHISIADAGSKTGYARTGCSKTGYAGQLITILERTQKEYIHDHPSDRMFPGSSQDP